MTIAISGTNGITLDGQFNSASSFGFKNRIINGGMVIDQRNAGASVTNTTAVLYSADRFAMVGSVASKYTAQQNSTAPVGFVKSILATSSSAYTVGTSEYFQIAQRIEGNNIADLAWGTVNAVTVTLSFQVRSSLTGTFGGSLYSYSGDISYPFSYTISSANTWETKSITIAGPTTGTFPTDNSGSLVVGFSLGAGATVSGTAGSWSSTLYRSSTSATSVVGTNGATFYITGVQLEKGSTATSFDYRPYGTELELCQRYFEITGETINTFLLQGYAASASAIRCPIFYATRKRAAPTVTVSGGGVTGWTYSNGSGLFISNAGTDTTRMEWNSAGAGTTFVYNQNGGFITSSAEL